MINFKKQPILIGLNEYRFLYANRICDTYRCIYKERAECLSTLKIYFDDLSKMVPTTHSPKCKSINFNLKNKSSFIDRDEETYVAGIKCYHQKNSLNQQLDWYKTNENNMLECDKKSVIEMPKLLTHNQTKLLHQSVREAFNERNMLFSDDLIVPDDLLSDLQNNNIKYDIPEANDSTKKVFYKAKQSMIYCLYAPIKLVKHSENVGYIVIATDDIEINTFICEYAGEVKFEKENKNVESDSIFILAKTDDENTTLEVVPDKISNIAKFISGIKNSPTMKKEANVESFICNINNIPHIILKAKKNIKKGSVLYYDYNNGKLDKYPTSHFKVIK